MLSDLPPQWNQIRHRLLKNPAIYSQTEKLIELLDFCALSPILRGLILQISLSRLLFCRYLGDIRYPCVSATSDKYVVSNFTNDTKSYFTDLNELISSVETDILLIDEQLWRGL